MWYLRSTYALQVCLWCFNTPGPVDLGRVPLSKYATCEYKYFNTRAHVVVDPASIRTSLYAPVPAPAGDITFHVSGTLPGLTIQPVMHRRSRSSAFHILLH